MGGILGTSVVGVFMFFVQPCREVGVTCLVGLIGSVYRGTV